MRFYRLFVHFVHFVWELIYRNILFILHIENAHFAQMMKGKI